VPPDRCHGALSRGFRHMKTLTNRINTPFNTMAMPAAIWIASEP
jgi:hypothetical protein